jgi:hypothetical protein
MEPFLMIVMAVITSTTVCKKPLASTVPDDLLINQNTYKKQ